MTVGVVRPAGEKAAGGKAAAEKAAAEMAAAEMAAAEAAAGVLAEAEALEAFEEVERRALWRRWQEWWRLLGRRRRPHDVWEVSGCLSGCRPNATGAHPPSRQHWAPANDPVGRIP